MAESTSPKGTSGDFAKKVQRQLSRSKEKVLQKLGKTLETRDDQFDQCLQTFIDQQADGNRIYKDLRNYITAVRDMREASRRLSQSLFDVYEIDWAGEVDLGAIVEGEDLLWNDFEVKLIDQTVCTMESYVGQFPDMREKIAKRGRKLVDYDSCLRHLEAQQSSKKRDDIKINKAKEEMKAAKAVYERINSELKDELPVLHDSRIGCYVAVFSSVSNLRDIFYKEMNTLNLDLQSVIKELQAQHPDKGFAVRGVQRHGSLRRTLMSPRAWKSSFSEFHRSYSPRNSQRSSFRSSDKSRSGTLSREGSTLGISSKPSSLENPLSESRELDAASSHSERRSSAGQDASASTVEASGTELKTEEESSQAGGGDASKEPAEEKDGEKAPPSASSSELNVSCDSESLELQLSAAHSGPLHIEEDAVTSDPDKPNGLENGVVSGLNSDPKNLSTLHKDAAGKEAPQDSKSTTV